MSVFNSILSHIKANENSVFFGKDLVSLKIDEGAATLVVNESNENIVVDTAPVYCNDGWRLNYTSQAGEQGYIRCQNENFMFLGLANSMLNSKSVSAKTHIEISEALNDAFKYLFDSFVQRNALVKKYSTETCSSYSIPIWHGKETQVDHLLIIDEQDENSISLVGINSCNLKQIASTVINSEFTVETIKASGVVDTVKDLGTEHFERVCQALKDILVKNFISKWSD